MINELFLFVDFDGILATNEDWLLLSHNDRFFCIRNRKIQAIEFIIRRHVKGKIYFVPISAWAQAFEDVAMLNDFLRERQVTFDAFEKQHIIRNSTARERVDCIKKFMDKFNIKEYIILDDECNRLYKKAGLNYVPYEVSLAKYYSNLIATLLGMSHHKSNI